MSFETFIGPKPPDDGHDYDCGCARCGSTIIWESCETCGGEGVDGHDCGEDCCCCLHPEDNMRCDMCGGTGGEYLCVSSEAWCNANPLEGREETPRHTPEWYRIKLGTDPGVEECQS